MKDVLHVTHLRKDERKILARQVRMSYAHRVYDEPVNWRLGKCLLFKKWAYCRPTVLARIEELLLVVQRIFNCSWAQQVFPTHLLFFLSDQHHLTAPDHSQQTWCFESSDSLERKSTQPIMKWESTLYGHTNSESVQSQSKSGQVVDYFGKNVRPLMNHRQKSQILYEWRINVTKARRIGSWVHE